MFVLADIEWIGEKSAEREATQIAAIKVDEKWNSIDTFTKLVKPDRGTYSSCNIAYNGGTKEDFCNANSAETVFKAFEKWLSEEDIILWWHPESIVTFKKVFRKATGIRSKHKANIINKYIYYALTGSTDYYGTQYQIAFTHGIDIRFAKAHNSADDAEVIRLLLSGIGFRQENFLVPIIEKNKEGNVLPYQYDPAKEMMHKTGCKKLEAERTETIGCETLKKTNYKNCKVCDCCKKEYKEYIMQRNMAMLAKSGVNFVYVPGSEVFHKYTCTAVMGSRFITGTVKYEKAAENGRRPCKHCKPCPEDEYNLRPIKRKYSLEKKSVRKSLPKDESRAIGRQKAALTERDAKLKDENLSLTEIKDIYTLTQPECAFWVAKGYQTFHLRNCPKMNGLSNFRGFKTFEEAVAAGYTPCRKCKPSSKNNVKLSIPISSKVRASEKIEEIEAMCEEMGFAYSFKENCLDIETPVGKWKVDTASSPVRMKHINLVITPNETNYHNQPRAFLSVTDAFEYIKNHDESLAKKKAEGKACVMFFGKKDF